jgi:hypothetical protein
MRFVPLLLCLACTPRVQGNPTEPANTVDGADSQSHTTPSSAAPAPERFVVSFGSICCGIDVKARQRLHDIAVPSGVRRRQSSWGKEGEEDECFDLSSLGDADRAAFMVRVRAAIAGGENVSIGEDGDCHQER